MTDRQKDQFCEDFFNEVVVPMCDEEWLDAPSDPATNKAMEDWFRAKGW
jgi:hypothetical protein